MKPLKEYVAWALMGDPLLRIPVPLKSIAKRIETTIRFAIRDYKNDCQKEKK